MSACLQDLGDSGSHLAVGADDYHFHRIRSLCSDGRVGTETRRRTPASGALLTSCVLQRKLTSTTATDMASMPRQLSQKSRPR